MALWKESTPAKKDPVAVPAPAQDSRSAERAQAAEPSRSREAKDSVIGAGLTIEGKILGSGHVRIAGRFHGDVQVQGDVTIERGAKLIGGIRAGTVTIGGELEGNIEAATRVDVLSTGILNGNLVAGSLTVAAGSRMHGQVTFGWEEEPSVARPEIVREGLGLA
jgi:cytoskeletal protein CcmA (bactofilin family)